MRRRWKHFVILNRAKGYYENDKERLREQARDNDLNLFEEKKNKKREYGKNRYAICLKKIYIYKKIIPKKLSRGEKVSI